MISKLRISNLNAGALLIYFIITVSLTCRQHLEATFIKHDRELRRHRHLTDPANQSIVWDPKTSTMLSSASLQDIADLNKLDIYNKSCFGDVAYGGHSENWVEPMTDKDEVLSGTTYWINEWIQLGHFMYDTVLFQAVATGEIDRVVVQRPICGRNEKGVHLYVLRHYNERPCTGERIWAPFLKVMLALISDAFPAVKQRKNPLAIYMRWDVFTDHSIWEPSYLHVNFSTGSIDVINPHLDNIFTYSQLKRHGYQGRLCFDRVVRRYQWGQTGKFILNAVSPAQAQQIKDIAYRFTQSVYQLHPKSFTFLNKFVNAPIDQTSILANRSLPMVHHFIASSPMIISYVYRVYVTRAPTNPEAITRGLMTAFPYPKYLVRAIEAREVELEKHIALAADSHVLICDHGAFQTNIMFLRNQSLFIDLRGVYFATDKYYEHGHAAVVEDFAPLFGVFMMHVLLMGLQKHEQETFQINDEEVQQVVHVIREYIRAEPFQLQQL